MKHMQRPIFWIALLFVVALNLQAGPVAEASGSLPPYPTPIPRPPAAPPSPRASVATIELQAPAAAGLWAGVQWQAADGQWFDVAGWQGPVDVTGGQRWWVEPKDFGAGPFRWRVYAQVGEATWGTSAAFMLPSAKGEWVTVTASRVATPAATPAGTVSQWAFAADQPAFKTYAADCGQYAIAGQVLGLEGQPLNGYRLQLVYANGDKEIISSGGAPDYGRSGFGFLLGWRRPNRLYQLQLLGPGNAGQPVSAVVPIVFTGACDQNFAWVVFRQVSP